MIELSTSLLDIALEAVKNGVCFEYIDGCMGYDRVYLDYKEEYGGYVLISKHLEYADLRPYKLNEYKQYWWLKEDKSE